MAIGVADMAYAIRHGRAHRAHGDLAYHVLEAMHGLYEASNRGRHYEMESTTDIAGDYAARCFAVHPGLITAPDQTGFNGRIQ